MSSGLEVTGQRLKPDRALFACRITDDDRWCRRCGEQGTVRDSVTRQLAHEPFGWRPTTLLVTVRRFRCAGCAHVWRQDTSKAAEPRAVLSRAAVGVESHCLPAPERVTGRRRTRSVARHRQQRNPRRRSPGPHRRPGPLRRSRGDRALTNMYGATPAAATSTSPSSST